VTVLTGAVTAADDFQLQYRMPRTADHFCGVDYLYVALRAAGSHALSLRELQEIVSPSANGVSLDILQKTCRSQGIFVTSLQLDPGALAYCRNPVVLHVNGRHFITFLGVEDGRITLFDSGFGLFDCSPDWFRTHYQWDGVSLVLGFPSPGLAAWILGPTWACVAMGAILLYFAVKLPWLRWKGVAGGG
jgi:hypothetical protein